MISYKNMKIPMTLYNRYLDMLSSVDFRTADEYIMHILRVEVAKYDIEQDGEILNREEEDLIKKRLRELGYLD